MRDDEEAQRGPIRKKEEGRGRYKFWALTAIAVLALCSMLTVSVTLKCSSVYNLTQDSDTADLDVLDVDDREKTVREMWNVYEHGGIVRLPSFWRDAFGAAYQDLTSEVATVRNAALLEIAKMSFGSHGGVVFDSPHLESPSRLSMEVQSSSTSARKTRKRK